MAIHDGGLRGRLEQVAELIEQDAVALRLRGTLEGERTVVLLEAAASRLRAGVAGDDWTEPGNILAHATWPKEDGPWLTALRKAIHNIGAAQQSIRPPFVQAPAASETDVAAFERVCAEASELLHVGAGFK